MCFVDPFVDLLLDLIMLEILSWVACSIPYLLMHACAQGQRIRDRQENY